MSEQKSKVQTAGTEPSDPQQHSIQQQPSFRPESGGPKTRSAPVLFVESMNLETLLERAGLDIENGFWPSAVSYADRALALDPSSAQAYLYRLLADLQAGSIEDLKNQKKPFDDNPNYRQIMTLGDPDLKEKLRDSNQHVCDHLSSLYQNELDQVRHGLAYARIVPDMLQAEETLKVIPDFPESNQLRAECARKRGELLPKTLDQAEKEASEYNWNEAVRLLESVSDHAEARTKLIEYRRMQEKENQYLQGAALQKEYKFREAAEVFAGLEGYRDSQQRLKQCNRMIKGKKVRAVGRKHTQAEWVNVLVSAFMAVGCMVSANTHFLISMLWGIPLIVFSIVMTIIRARYRPAKRMWIVMAATMGAVILLLATGVITFSPAQTALSSLVFLGFMLCNIFL